MLCTLILAASLSGQPPPPVATAEKAEQARKLIAKRKARKAVAYVKALNQAEAERRVTARNAGAAQAQYEKMLPYMLENQRQQLAAMDAANRNAALRRMASAMERQSGYSYPGQMPTPPTTLPSNPLYGPLMSPP